MTPLSSPEAKGRSTLLLKPLFPFRLEPAASRGRPKIIVRPAIPFRPTSHYSSWTGGADYNKVPAIGDIAYGVTEKFGLLWTAGTAGTPPTATGSDAGGMQKKTQFIDYDPMATKEPSLCTYHQER